MAWVREHPLAVGGAAVAVAVAAYLAIAFFGVHTLFFDDEVDEPGPVFASGAAPSGLASDAISEDIAAGMTAEMADEPVMVEVSEDMPVMNSRRTRDTDAHLDEDMPTPTSEQPEQQAVVGEVRTIYTGTFVDRSHPTSGRADVLNDGTEQRFLRLDEFETDNGPDLNVYLSTAPPDGDAGLFDDDFVDLGDLKGNIGSQNYEIPPGVDLDRYSTVVIWCVRFSVAFGAAEIAPS